MMSLKLLVLSVCLVVTQQQQEWWNQNSGNSGGNGNTYGTDANGQWTNTLGRNLVIIQAPSITDEYYQSRWDDLIAFYKVYANKVIGNDNIVVLTDQDTLQYLQGDIPDDVLLVSPNEDIWLRDFGIVRVAQPVMLKYLPEYLTDSDATIIQDLYKQFLSENGIQVTPRSNGQTRSSNGLEVPEFSDLVIDGGNVVDNRIDKAILSSRILTDNPGISRDQMKDYLKKALNYTNVAIVTQYGNVDTDTTGHSDGMLMFIEPDLIGIGDVDVGPMQKLRSELTNEFGNSVRMITLPSFYNDARDPNIDFTSACGVHLNALSTDNYIYMPTFGEDPVNQAAGYSTANDNTVFNIIQGNTTTKKVIKVPVPSKVCLLGGSVRCLSNQLTGPLADQLVRNARQR